MPGKKAKAAPHKKQSGKTEHKSEKSGTIGSLKKILSLGGDKAKEAGKSTAKKGASSQSQAQAHSHAHSMAKGVKTSAGKSTGTSEKKQETGSKQVVRPGKGSTQGVSQTGTKDGGRARLAKTSVAVPEIAAGSSVCREVACELMSTTGGYCRMHYIKNWKKIKRKEIILKEKKLNSYIEELVSKYPDKYIEAIRQDLASEKDFAKVIADLEIEEGLDDFESVETESAEGIIDNLKRDFEDEGDVF